MNQDAGTPVPTAQAQRPLLRLLLRGLALLALGVAVVGVFLPGLPSTEFVLLAAWAAARSSPCLHHWLVTHPRLGPPLRDWRDGRRVSRYGKWASAISMGICAVLLWWEPHAWVRWTAWIAMAIVLVWLWRRPLPRR
ncbi:MAG: YbaN family protein [Pseudomonas sp.]